MRELGPKKIPPAKEAAYIAVTCALLLGGQYVFSFVTGVEIVTLVLICFSYVFGIRNGVLCAVAFSLLRCFIYPFSPSALALYLIYYPALAAVFGGLGKIKQNVYDGCPAGFAVAVNFILLAAASLCAVCFALDLIKISKLYKLTVNVFLIVLCIICIVGDIAFNALFFLNRRGRRCGGYLKIIMLTGVACLCTVCFTLLDDVITPLFYGFSKLSALAYFYASFTAMLPQTVCTAVTVGTLFMPLTSVLNRMKK